MTWYHSLRSRVRVLAFAIYPKIVVDPSMSTYRPLESYVSFARRRSLPVARADFSLSHVIGGVEVYKWIALALSISSDFWLRWLVHEA